MKRLIWDTIKVTILFVCCTCLFYFGLRAMHEEYERYHRYDQPEGPAMRVFSEEDESLLDDLYLFFRLGE